MKKMIVLMTLLCAMLCLCVSKGYGLVLKLGDPQPKPVPLFSRIRFDIDNHRFHIDTKMRCRYNSCEKFRYRHNQPFTTPTNVYFEIGTVLKVTDSKIVYGSFTNTIGSKSCFLIEGKNIIPGRFVPNF